MMQVLAARTYPTVSVPDDFIEQCLRDMARLKEFEKYNVVYGLVHGLGMMRDDGSDSRLPVLRMPMGMLEYIISFFEAESINKVWGENNTTQQLQSFLLCNNLSRVMPS